MPYPPPVGALNQSWSTERKKQNELRKRSLDNIEPIVFKMKQMNLSSDILIIKHGINDTRTLLYHIFWHTPIHIVLNMRYTEYIGKLICIYEKFPQEALKKFDKSHQKVYDSGNTQTFSFAYSENFQQQVAFQITFWIKDCWYAEQK